MNAGRPLARLEDVRLLPIFVIVSMAIGIAIGKAPAISDFELTQPIDATKDIAGGTFDLPVARAMPMALVSVALSSFVQMLLIPIYARLLIGTVEFDVLVVGQSVLLYLGLPLVLSVPTRFLVARRGARRPWSACSPASTPCRSCACSSRSS